ncbi:MAG TPA: lipoprotein-releasing system transmembrane subunit LolC [Elusimicrobia bacterium]|nr:lipoprotein-releasing system transmembrane subunit LolC [Elusimicrobiota bacterium]HBT62005.1 lipoprotein-releasing system transmembrane subunit LolC [Elusimicrobiota bacterium]
MNLAFFIAWRYLKAERKGLFAVVTTSIGVAGVMVGVAALITTLSVMNGFQADIQKKVIGAQSHLNVYGAREARDFSRLQEILNADPNVVATAPFVLGQAILSAGDRTIGMVLKGLDPEQEFKVNSLASSLSEGSWQGLKPAASSRSQGLPSPLPGIVLGEELARAVGAGVGSTVVLVSPKSVATPFGMLPKMQKFLVTGLLHTGYYEYDSTTGYSDIASTAKFFGIEAGATGVSARLHDLGRCAAAARSLQIRLGPAYVVRTYDQMNRTLFAALKLEKAVMFIILTLITLVASLNIASTLILRSVEKTRDIGLLKAMGATPGQIRRIFWIEGFIIGAAGVAMGLLLGLLLCFIIWRYPIVELPADIYYLSRVPVSVELWDVISVMVMGVLLSLLATVYPALRAAKVNPVEAIHYG